MKKEAEREAHQQHQQQVEADRARKEQIRARNAAKEERRVADKERERAEKRKRHEEVLEEHQQRKVAKLGIEFPKPDEGDEDEDDGVDEDDPDRGEDEDDLDEDAIEAFMNDIEAEDKKKGRKDDSDDSDADDKDADGDATMSDARTLLKEKRAKRLAEDEAFEATKPTRKELEKQRRANVEQDERLVRTVFLGNIPTQIKPHKLQKWFEQMLGQDEAHVAAHGSPVESIRIRSIAVADPKLPKRIAIQKGLLHDQRDSANAYVVLKDEKLVLEAVEKCRGQTLEYEGKEFHVRCDACDADKKKKPVFTNTVFVGNLPFDINENELYEHFEDCGHIEDVRVIRDRTSGMGKGIAFITFKKEQDMRNALASNMTKFRERELRITKAVENKKLHHTTAPADKKSSSASSSGSSSSTPTSSSGAPRREGKGGPQKVKELNRAGVWKKPRHVPRGGADGGAGKDSNANAKTNTTKKKRAFEGEHADPTQVVKKQKMDDARHKEKKEKRKESKKLGASTKKD